MKSERLYQPYKTEHSETVAFGVLALAGLIIVGVALVASSDFVRGKEQVVAALSGKRPPPYFSSGRWLADARTAAALIRYLCESESDPFTNGLHPGEDGAWIQPVGAEVRTFAARGVITQLGGDGRMVTFSKESIGGFAPALTLPILVTDPRGLAGLRIGDQIAFRLSVTSTQSWIGEIKRIGEVRLAQPRNPWA
jgi:hypothetical protein